MAEPKHTKKRFISLRLKALMSMLIGTICFFLIFATCRTVGNWLVENAYDGEAATSRRFNRLSADFQDYVDENALSSTDWDAIRNWCPRYVYLSIQSNGNTIFESYWSDDEIQEALANADTSPSASDSADLSEDTTDVIDDTFSVVFLDGTYSVGLLDFSSSSLYDMIYYISLIAGLLAPLISVLLYNKNTIRSIRTLSQEVRAVSGGDLFQAVASHRQDEIGLLAEDVNTMRLSLIERIEKEEHAWRSNSQLITSLSHDMRTPLTTIIGYLEIVRNQEYGSEELGQQYLNIAYEKSIQLKDLSDELFSYFLIFGQPDIEIKWESYDAALLLPQLIFDNSMLLQDSGFQVNFSIPEGSCMISVDISLMKRVFDNLFSNLSKYADPNREISIAIVFQQKDVVISLSNSVNPSKMLKESTKIGLKTCQKIMQQLHGTFSAQRSGDSFTVRMTLPIQSDAIKV